MSKIAIVNTTHFDNKGSMGRLIGLINCLRKSLPDSQITIFHRYYKQDQGTFIKRLTQEYPGLDFKDHPWYREASSSFITAIGALVRYSWVSLQRNSELQKYDVIIDLNHIEPERFTDSIVWQNEVGIFLALLNTQYMVHAGKPVMVCSATIGPYSSRFLRNLAIRVFNRTQMITLREHFSRDYLKKIGIVKPDIHLTADLAFLLKPGEKEKSAPVKEKADNSSSPYIGIAPAAMMNSFINQSQYIELLAQLSDWQVAKLGAKISYIVHTYQDQKIAEAITAKVKNKERVNIIAGISEAETKILISKLDLFIGLRFHALVAATSNQIPSLGVVTYSKNKFYGIIGEMLGQNDYLLSIDQDFKHDAFLEKLKNKTQELLSNRKMVAEKLKNKTREAEESALLNGILVKKLLKNNEK